MGGCQGVAMEVYDVVMGLLSSLRKLQGSSYGVVECSRKQLGCCNGVPRVFKAAKTLL